MRTLVHPPIILTAPLIYACAIPLFALDETDRIIQVLLAMLWYPAGAPPVLR